VQFKNIYYNLIKSILEVALQTLRGSLLNVFATKFEILSFTVLLCTAVMIE